MKLFLIRILFRLLRVPKTKGGVNAVQMREWLGLQYPVKGFRDYIESRDMAILQNMGEGADRENYLLLIGQRIELGRLLTEAKNNFNKAERERLKKKNESINNKKG